MGSMGPGLIKEAQKQSQEKNKGIGSPQTGLVLMASWDARRHPGLCTPGLMGDALPWEAGTLGQGGTLQ